MLKLALAVVILLSLLGFDVNKRDTVALKGDRPVILFFGNSQAGTFSELIPWTDHTFWYLRENLPQFEFRVAHEQGTTTDDWANQTSWTDTAVALLPADAFIIGCTHHDPTVVSAGDFKTNLEVIIARDAGAAWFINKIPKDPDNLPVSATDTAIQALNSEIQDLCDENSNVFCCYDAYTDLDTGADFGSLTSTRHPDASGTAKIGAGLVTCLTANQGEI